MTKLFINDLSGKCKEFSEACYDSNSIDELCEILQEGDDPTDCKEWGISGSEWYDAVNAALNQKIVDRGSEII